LERCPPKAKVTRSNRVGCATSLNNLALVLRHSNSGVSAECPRNGSHPVLREPREHGG
jgi:hypothetical protein